MVLNSMNAKVRALSSRDVGNGRAMTTLTLEVRDRDELNAVIARLTAVPGVREVQRING